MFRLKFKTQNSKFKTRRKRNKKLEWFENTEIKRIIKELSKDKEFVHINPGRIFCFSTTGSKSRAIARIWSFPKIFQQALCIEPAYVIEVISERFNKMDKNEKIKVIIHELLHIPRNFSGSLLPHKYGNKRIDKEVERIYQQLYF